MTDDNPPIPITPASPALTPQAAVALVNQFLHLACHLLDPDAARLLMTIDAANVPAFDPRGLGGNEYVIGEPFIHETKVIFPVVFSDATNLQATCPLVVTLESGEAKIDVAATVELMMGGQVQYVDAADIEDDAEPDEPTATS